MTDVTDARTIIQTEEVSYRSAVSESVFTKVAGVSNFISNRQYDTKTFYLNGPYNNSQGTTGLDGLFIFPFDCEVIGHCMFNMVGGSSGTTTLDIHYYDGAGSDQGTIFSTKPSITSAAVDGAYVGYNITTATDLGGGTGMTKGVISTTDFDAGDALRLDLDGYMPSAENCGIHIYLRPR